MIPRGHYAGKLFAQPSSVAICNRYKYLPLDAVGQNVVQPTSLEEY